VHNAKGKHGPKTRRENTLLMNLDSRHVTFQQESIRHAQTKEEFWTWQFGMRSPRRGWKIHHPAGILLREICKAFLLIAQRLGRLSYVLRWHHTDGCAANRHPTVGRRVSESCFRSNTSLQLSHKQTNVI